MTTLAERDADAGGPAIDRPVPPPSTRPSRKATTAAAAVPATPVGLPGPPTDTERDHYLRRRHRWTPLVATAGSALTTVSLIFLLDGQPWAWPLVAIMALSIGTSTGLILVTGCRRRRDGPADHRGRVRRWHRRRPPGDHPSVDVFLPTAGEDLAVLENTLTGVAGLRWRGALSVLVLDDSARPEVAELAARFGARYLTRPDRGRMKKAGNLQFGYDNSAGDLIVILDADFVPRADLLEELVPYLDDPQVGIVQSPQYFDLHRRMNWVQLSAGATQVLFYRWIQPSWDRSDASICVGTSAVYRRSALQRVGGFPQIGHSEDIYTGILLLEKGFRQRYVPVVVTKGMCPDTLDSFLAQQYRWASGSLSLLFSRRFHRMPLTFTQRLSYWSGFCYYLETAINVFLTALPPILLGIISPADVHPVNYLLVLLALTIRAGIVPLISGGQDTVTGLARIQAAYSFAHMIALVDVLRRRTDPWQATGATGGGGSGRTARRITRLATGWLIAVQVATWGVLGWRAPEYGWLNYSLMAAFGLLQLVTVYPLLCRRTEFPRAFDPMTPRRLLPGYLTEPV